ncbi:hypothetical protein D3C75_892460 [compost metagenome]
MGHDYFEHRIPRNSQDDTKHAEHFTGKYNYKNNGYRMNLQRFTHNLRGDELAFNQLDSGPDKDHLQQHKRRCYQRHNQSRRDGNSGTQIGHYRSTCSNNRQYQRILQADDQITDIEQCADTAADDDLSADIRSHLAVHFLHHHTGLRLQAVRDESHQVVGQAFAVAEQVEQDKRCGYHSQNNLRQCTYEIPDPIHCIIEKSCGPGRHFAR